MVSFCRAQMADLLRYDLGSLSPGDRAALWLNGCASVGDQPPTLFSATLHSFWIQTNSVLSKSEAPPVLVGSPQYGCAAGGGGEPLFIMDVCMCVSSSDPPPFIFLSLSYVSSPPPPVCVFPALFLTLGREEQKLLHYIDGESSPTLLTHAQCIYRILWSPILPER